MSTNSTSTPLSPPPVTRLEEAKERVLDLSLDLVCIAGMDGWLRYVNPAWEQTLGWSREELLSRPFLDFIHPDDHAKSGAEVDSLAAGRPTTNFENRYLHRDGSLRTISWKATPSRDERLIFCIGRDVTAQRRAEARAARQLRLLAAINHVLRTTLTSASEERLAVACLAAAEEITGSRFGFIDQLNARGLFDVVAISDPGWAACRMANPRAELRDIAFRGLHSQVIAEGRSLLCNAPARHPAWCGVPEGHPLIECYLATPLRDGERLFGMMAVANKAGGYDADDQADLETLAPVVVEVLLRWRAEAALAGERERLAVTLRSIGDGVITTDREGAITSLNAIAEQLTGWSQEEAAGRPLPEVFRILHQQTRQPCADPVRRVLTTGHIVGLANHTVLLARDGTERILADSGAPIRDRQSRIVGVVLVFRDVTEEHRREQELQRAQKLESVGVLAGGIAHDFNNLLTAVLGNVSLARLDAEPAGRQAAWLAEAEKAIARTRDLTQQLLTFARGGAPIRSSAHLGEMIMDTTGFTLHGSNVRCVFDLADDLWPVEADIGQLSQVIANLVINADEAMPRGGTLRLSARNLPAGVPRPAGAPVGPCVEIAVEDEGVGIDSRHLLRVFDPYFTTKKKGSGLGLTTSYSIVRKHDGTITAESRQGQGSTFRVFLPTSSRMPTPPPSEQAVAPGHGRILVMDDEEMVLSVARQMLIYLGYEVETAPDGAAAVEIYARARAEGRPFVAVLLDITVPGEMGGEQALPLLRAIDPDVRAVVSSGYANDPILADFQRYGFRGIVAKPYDLKRLSRALRSVLDGLPGERTGTPPTAP